MSGLPEFELQRMARRLKQVAQGFDEFDELPSDSAETIGYDWMAEVGKFIVLLAKEKILDLPGLDEAVAAYETSEEEPDWRGLSVRSLRVFQQVVGYKKQPGITAPGLISCAAPSLTPVYVPYEGDFWRLAAHYLAHACEVLHVMVNNSLADRVKEQSGDCESTAREPLQEASLTLEENQAACDTKSEAASEQSGDNELAPTERESLQEAPPIPEKDQSIYVTMEVAACALYPGLAKLTARRQLHSAMEKGEIRYMRLSRQSYIFDCTQITTLKRRSPT